MEEKKRTYLDDCKSPEEKTKAVIQRRSTRRYLTDSIFRHVNTTVLLSLVGFLSTVSILGYLLTSL